MLEMSRKNVWCLRHLPATSLGAMPFLDVSMVKMVCRIAVTSLKHFGFQTERYRPAISWSCIRARAVTAVRKTKADKRRISTTGIRRALYGLVALCQCWCGLQIG